MTASDRYKQLFEPLKVGPKTMHERFYMVPHCTGFGAARLGAQAFIDITAGEGGWADLNPPVQITHRNSDNKIYRELVANRHRRADGGIGRVFGTGDCVASWPIADAEFNGCRLARKIGSKNPATPLPFICGRRVAAEKKPLSV